MARHAGKDGGILGEADLVTAGWGTLCRGLLWGVHQTVWRNVRFLRHEIEGARADFLALLEGFSGVGLRSGAQNFLRPSRPPSHKIIRRRDFMLTKTFVRNRKDNYFYSPHAIRPPIPLQRMGLDWQDTKRPKLGGLSNG
jgi:hypothetical protein